MAFSNWVFTEPFFMEWEAAAKASSNTSKLVHNYRFRPAEELFDDDMDPYNLRNLANNPKYEKIKEGLRKQLYKWMEENGDKGVITELLTMQHMPSQRSEFPVAIDTTLHRSKIIKSAWHIKAPVDGYYTFYLSGEGNLEVDGKVVIPYNPKATLKTKRYLVNLCRKR